jgi:predicted ribosome quality control (RQC) complex YloA/Tae2 family protein
MGFDALTLTAVRDELAPVVSGARIQKVVFVDELSLAVEFFAPHIGRMSVLLSAHLEHARVQRLSHLPTRGVEHDSPFGLLVRKHLRRARVRSIHQPRLERVFELDCEQRDPSDRLYRVVLIVEAMGRRSNLVLVDAEGVILDAARRTPPIRTRRPVLPHLPYAPPPPQNRLWPEDISCQALSVGANGPLDKWLAQRVAGLSPLAAREIVYRATGALQTDTNAIDWAHLASTTRSFLAMIDARDWSPTVAFNADDQPADYAPYELRHLAAAGNRLERHGTVSAAIEDYFAHLEPEPRRRRDSLAAERKALVTPIERAASSTARRIAALEHQLSLGHADREPLRRAGDVILAHLSEIPAMAAEFTVDGERVDLDPRLSPVENAQAYFARYRKAREAEERVPHLLDEARHFAEHLADLRTLVEVADQMDDIRALRREVAAATGTRAQSDSKKAPRSSAPAYRRIPITDQWDVLVGTSAAGNATVTFDVARGDDLWLHARGVSGAHVIVRGKGEPPPEVVERAAQLAAGHSASREAGAVEVDVTRRRYVKKVAGGPPGLVRYANEHTLRVTPRN